MLSRSIRALSSGAAELNRWAHHQQPFPYQLIISALAQFHVTLSLWPDCLIQHITQIPLTQTTRISIVGTEPVPNAGGRCIVYYLAVSSAVVENMLASLRWCQPHKM